MNEKQNKNNQDFDDLELNSSAQNSNDLNEEDYKDSQKFFSLEEESLSDEKNNYNEEENFNKDQSGYFESDIDKEKREPTSFGEILEEREKEKGFYAHKEEDGFQDDKERENNTEQKNSSVESEQTIISETKLFAIKKMLKEINEKSNQIINLLGGIIDKEDERRIKIGQTGDSISDSIKKEDILDSDYEDKETEKIVEGIFDGEKMIGTNGKHYNVPANYASKSKLVEGDLLKLTITGTGTFVYKQIGPVERLRLVGKLIKSEDGSYHVIVNDPTLGQEEKKWRILPASVTYFHGEEGDETIILIPKLGNTQWAAVENIIKP